MEDYRVGDEVIIDPNLKRGNDHVFYVARQMEALKGRIATITRRSDYFDGYASVPRFNIDIDEMGFLWTADMFFPVVESKEYHPSLEEYPQNLDKVSFEKSLNELL